MMKTYLIIFLWLLPALVSAELNIEISGGNEYATKIAVAHFDMPGGDSALKSDLSRIIMDDLDRSGRFRALDAANFGASPSLKDQTPDFTPWKKTEIEYLVIGRIRMSGGLYVTEFKLYSTASGNLLLHDKVKSSIQDQRLGAHYVADLIYERLTGQPGAFATRLAYIVAKGSNRALKIADSDGQNSRTVYSLDRPLLSPSWSPDGKQLAYVSYESGFPGIYVQHLSSGARRLLAQFPGINSAPAWSPDGTRMAMSLSKDGNPEIYVMDLPSKKLTRLTNSPAIDTEPCWSGDGRFIAFTSDRSGSPQIYRVSASGGAAQRLSFEGSYNSDPSWSGDGKYIALVSRQGGDHIALLRPDSRGMQFVSKGGLNESPSFSPNSAMLVYATSSNVLSVVSVDYDVQQKLTVAGDGEVRDPAWSPYLIKR